MIRMNLILLFFALLLSPWAQAKVSLVSPEQGLQAALDAAQDGDRLELAAGLYRGNFQINREVSLIGKDGVIIDGNGEYDAIRVLANNVTIEKLQIRNWGDDLTDTNAGIFVDRVTNTLITGNTLKGNAFGVWLGNSVSSRVIGNRIEGNPELRSADRGNGIHLSSTKNAEILDNEVWHTRDGLYILTSNNNRLERNYLHDLRFGVHYMYSNNNSVIGNVTERTRTGYALMQSTGLTVTDNVSRSDKNYGILLNFITYSKVSNNRVVGVQANRDIHSNSAGGSNINGVDGKALFVYNSLFNDIRSNLFADSDLGVHLTAGSEDNQITLNAFVGNRTQVKYVASREQEWSEQGYGNYWSDYLGWDMNGDGLGDIPYEPNDSMDQVLWRYPFARVLINAPAIELLRWVQREFPVFKAQGVRDSYPLMANPVPFESGAIDDPDSDQAVVRRTRNKAEVPSANELMREQKEKQTL